MLTNNVEIACKQLNRDTFGEVYLLSILIISPVEHAFRNMEQYGVKYTIQQWVNDWVGLVNCATYQTTAEVNKCFEQIFNFQIDI